VSIAHWTYSQSSGALWDRSGKLIAKGYSGYKDGKNNPKLEAVKNVGPIPRGTWIIYEKYNSGNIGPEALKLQPSGHNALGRTYFRIHGDSRKNFGNASKGCIIFPPDIRMLIWNSGVKILEVIE
jgi:hypothetical protein